MKFAIIMVEVVMVMSPSWDQEGGSGGITDPERKPLAGWHQQGGWSGVQGGGAIPILDETIYECCTAFQRTRAPEGHSCKVLDWYGLPQSYNPEFDCL